MTTARTIEMARSFIKTGNNFSYAQLMSSAIRSARSERVANTIRAAIIEDKMEAHFHLLYGDCPLAA